MSEAGSCCATNPSANVTLDRAGQCCSEGLDACGVCGGDGLTLDFTGVCCNGAIDASGLCCAAPNVVDDFGVCGGNSSTGVIVLELDVLSSSVAGASNGVVFTLLLDVKVDCGGLTAELTQLVNVYHVPDLMVLSNALAQYKQ